jgi:hypothetical protein
MPRNIPDAVFGSSSVISPRRHCRRNQSVIASPVRRMAISRSAPMPQPNDLSRSLVARQATDGMRSRGSGSQRTLCWVPGRAIRPFGRGEDVFQRSGVRPIGLAGPGFRTSGSPAGWISALERGRFQGYKQKRKLKSGAPFARNRKFESISLQQRVTCELDFGGDALCTASSPPSMPAGAI